MQKIKPIIDKKKFSLSVTRVLDEFFIKVFWSKIASILLPIGELENSANEDVVIEAIRSGRIEYVDGKFHGQFNSHISKALIDMGAKYNKVTKTFDIAQDMLSVEVLEAIAATSIVSNAIRMELIRFLNDFTIENFMPDLQKVLEVPLDEILDDLDDQAYETLKDSISIEPRITPELRETLKEEYTENMELYIKNFTQRQIIELREIVEKNNFQQNTNDSLILQIQKRFDVTYTKAKFLANQETSLLVAAYRKQRYTSAGITKYRWSTSHDSRVRKEHKELDGQIFEFANPPIVNKKGDRKNPGEDFGCRCIAIPII